MTNIDVEAYRRKVQREYEAGIAELRRAYEARLEAIEWVDSQQGSAAEPAPATKAEQASNVRLPAALKPDVEAAIPSRGLFTLSELHKWLGTSGIGRVALRRQLSKLVAAGAIQIAHKGKGGRATKYRRCAPEGGTNAA